MAKNRFECTGYVVADPECREARNTPVANVRIAVNEKWKTKEGEKKERTDYFNCVAWGGWAKVIKEHVKKGMLLCVAGPLREREGRKDNIVYKDKEMEIKELQMLSFPKNGEGQQVTPPVPDGPDDLPF